MKDLMRAIEDRHSERGPFDTSKQIDQADLEMILQSARWAPTPHNMQNFEILIVDDPEQINQLKEIRADASEAFLKESYEQLSFSEDELKRKGTGLLASLYPDTWSNPEAWRPDSDYRSQLAFLKSWMRDTPMLLILFHDGRRRAPASEGDALGYISLGCVLQNMWLASEAVGLAFQVLSTVSNDQVNLTVKDMFGLPGWAHVDLALRVGYPLEPSRKLVRVRRSVEQICHYNRYGNHDVPGHVQTKEEIAPSLV